MAMVVTRREIQDSFRDWRIVVPIILLTIGFPGLMNFTAQRLLSFANNFGAGIVGNQLIPFLLLVVGFFPMSFSLIIALEAFVGEKERRSLEPLLATPLTNLQLYMGKMMAALVPPLMASYLGMTVYIVGLRFSIDWQPDFELLLQIFVLTTIQGIIMVAGAVVVSSQVTSVRASNLLASFIIVPMALLIQGEAAALFWGTRGGLWWLALALFMTALVLIRMGVQIFNREELMGRELDQLRIGWMWRQFWVAFSGWNEENGRYPHLFAWYRQTGTLIRQLRLPITALLLALALATIIGVTMSQRYVFPAEIQSQLGGENLRENLDYLDTVSNSLSPIIVLQNVRAVVIQVMLGIFTLGVLGVLVFMLPWTLIAALAAQFSLAGENPWMFLTATVLPHAIVELPALLIIGAAALRWQTVIMAPPPRHTLSEAFLRRGGEFFRVFLGIGLPLLILAALLEATVTPAVVRWFYG